MNYEQYHQKGGTYVIPVEVFDNLLDEKEELDKEKEELIDYLKEEINECKLTGNDEDYIKIDVYEEILSKIEKE